MAIDFKTFSNVINPILNAKFPVLIRGRHGIGKSTIVYQKAKELGIKGVEPVKSGGERHIVGARHGLGALASGAQIVLAQPFDGAHTGAQVCPIGIRGSGTRHIHGHANNSDVLTCERAALGGVHWSTNHPIPRPKTSMSPLGELKIMPAFSTDKSGKNEPKPHLSPQF